MLPPVTVYMVRRKTCCMVRCLSSSQICTTRIFLCGHSCFLALTTSSAYRFAKRSFSHRNTTRLSETGQTGSFRVLHHEFLLAQLISCSFLRYPNSPEALLRQQKFWVSSTSQNKRQGDQPSPSVHNSLLLYHLSQGVAYYAPICKSDIICSDLSIILCI